ncbi:MAG: prepilin peptidase [Planctomycetaceae bacterium]|nr:prepilin peptidase [Planctomycetaceae bacterium]
MFYIILTVIIGCCVGSFLNVAVYRLPLGKSLSYPPSHCPKCKHPIRPYDNFPVLGWFLLRGRCRDCRERISLRYPVVEFVSGLIAGSISGVVFYSHNEVSYFDLLVISLYYFVLVITFFAAGLIEFDRNNIPAKLFIPVTIITPFVFYYLDSIKFYAVLNSANLLCTIGTIVICGVIVFFSQPYFVQLATTKTKKHLTRRNIRVQIMLPFLTVLVLGLSCGIIAIPILFFGIRIALLFLRYKKSRRLYLLLTGAIWITIIYKLFTL